MTAESLAPVIYGDNIQQIVTIIKRTKEAYYSIVPVACSPDFASKLREQTLLIAELRNAIAPLLPPSLGGKIRQEVEYLGLMADKALSEDSTFGMEVLLIPYGSRDGDPDKLDLLLSKIEKVRYKT